MGDSHEVSNHPETKPEERSQLERELEASRARLLDLLELMPGAFVSLDRDFRLTFVNGAAARMMRKSAEELLGTVVWDEFPRAFGRSFEEAILRARAEWIPVEFEAHHEQSEVWFEVQIHPVGDWLSAYFRDITSRKQAEAQVRDAEERFRTLVEQIPAVTYVDDGVGEGGTTLYISPQVEPLLGHPPKDWLDDPDFWPRHIHPEDRERILAEDRRCRASGEPFDMEYRMMSKDDRVVWFHDRFVLIRNEDGRPLFARGVLLDVTERKEAEEALRRADQRYRDIFEHAGEGIFQAGVDGRFLMANRALARIAGYESPEDLTAGVPGIQALLADPKDWDRLVQLVGSEGAVSGFETRGRRKDGGTAWLSLSAHSLPEAEGETTGIEGTVVDVSDAHIAAQERAALHARLVDAQERERERIAADIHDDSLQKMTAVALRLHAIARQLDDDTAREGLAKLEDAVEQSISRLRHLMFELRPPALDREGLVAAVRLLVQETFGGTIEFTVVDGLTQEPESETRTTVYRIVQEAVSNVRKHARAGSARALVETVDGGVRVQITDDGEGFESQEALSPQTGHLGVPAMRQRAELAGGWWRVESRPGSGTTVEFWIPDRPREVSAPDS